MGLVGNQQIQLRVLLNLYTDLIQALDGGIAGEEILGTGAKGDNFQLAQADEGACDGHELADHLGNFFRSTHRIFGNKCFEMAHTQVVGAVEHAAVSIAAAIDEVAVPLGGGSVHAGTVKVLGNQRLRRFGAEVAQEDGQGVASGGFDLLDSLQHVLLIFHGRLALVDIRALGLAGGSDGGTAALGQVNDEAVAGYGDDAQFDLRNVSQIHSSFPPYKI